MSRIFIIGNGYDMSRRGDTSYCKFKEWLNDKYIKNLNHSLYYENEGIDFSIFNQCSIFSGSIYETILKAENEKEQEKIDALIYQIEDYRKKICCSILFDPMKRLDDEQEWKNFENDLSLIPFKMICDKYKKSNIDNGLELQTMFGTNIEKEVGLVTSMPIVIKTLFAEWINSLSKIKIKKGLFEKIIKNIKSNDIFIIFNYIKTIENLFKNHNFSNFYHIHGTYDRPNSIIVGHNCKSKSKFTNCVYSVISF